MNNFSINDKFWFYTYSLLLLLVTDFQFNWVSFLITTPFDALLLKTACLTIGFSSGLFNLKSSCRCLSADVVAFHQDLLLQTQCCSSWKSCPPDSVNAPLLQCPLHAPDLLRSPLSIAAPNAFHRSASASYQFTVGSQTDALGIYDALPPGL